MWGARTDAGCWLTARPARTTPAAAPRRRPAASIRSRPSRAAPTIGGASTTRTTASGACVGQQPGDLVHQQRVAGGEHAAAEHDVDRRSRGRRAGGSRWPPGRPPPRPGGARRRAATASPASATANSSGVSSMQRSSGRAPRWTASISAAIDESPKCRGSAVRSAVSGPRPSSARAAHHIASCQRWPPPPQSPEMCPTAANRTVVPSGTHAGAVDPRAADHRDAARGVQAGAQQREGVVDDLVRRRPAGLGDRGLERLVLDREVGVGQAGGDVPHLDRARLATAPRRPQARSTRRRRRRPCGAAGTARPGRCPAARRPRRRRRRRSCCSRRRWRGRSTALVIRPTAGAPGCGRAAGR